MFGSIEHLLKLTTFSQKLNFFGSLFFQPHLFVRKNKGREEIKSSKGKCVPIANFNSAFIKLQNFLRTDDGAIVCRSLRAPENIFVYSGIEIK